MGPVFEKLIIKVAQTRLKPKKAPEDISNLYLKYLALIESCYFKAGFWHGTGRFHYRLEGSSKYQGVDYSHVFDVLGAIVKSQGIIPEYDPIPELDPKHPNTVSLSKFRMYARLYAEMNQPKGEELGYTYGSDRFWFYLGVPLQLIYKNPLQNLFLLISYYLNKDEMNDFQNWIHSFKHSSKSFKATPLNFYKLRSDIDGNYGILIGIKKNSVKAVHYNPVLERFETRTDQPILLSDITHLEVTLSKLEETQGFLDKHHLKIPLIPIELGDLYCSQFNLGDLCGVTSNPADLTAPD